MPRTLTIRTTGRDDFDAVDRLLSQSYPALLKRDYAPSVVVTALPRISRANPKLLRSGRYYLIEDEHAQVVGAGGWSRAGPVGGAPRAGLGHIRHVVTDHRRIRQGIGRALMRHTLDAARQAGVRRLDCLSTLTAVPFYRALGFSAAGAVELSLAPGIRFPAVQMHLDLR